MPSNRKKADVTSAEREAEIQDLERRERENLRHLDQTMPTIAADMAPIAVRWLKSEVHRQIDAAPDKFQQLGASRAQEMKRAVEDLYARIPTIAAEALSDKTEWPHYNSKWAHAQAYFDSAYLNTINAVGPILAEYGMHQGREQGAILWRVEKTGVRYAGDPGLSNAQLQSILGYQQSLARLRGLQKEMQSKREAHAKASARELWDSV